MTEEGAETQATETCLQPVNGRLGLKARVIKHTEMATSFLVSEQEYS